MQPSLRYNPALDGLRAIAALLVIADHCRVPQFSSGYFGVDLFFVLSGYLITGLLVEEIGARGRLDLPGFYLRRFLRLTPPLFLMLAVYLALAPTLWPHYGLWQHVGDAGLAGFYLSDYAQAFWKRPDMLLHTWSLAVEEHFYLLWPFAILLLTRIKLRWRVAALVGLYLLASLWRIFEYERLGWFVAYYRFDTRLSGLMLGSLLAIVLPRLRISEETANGVGLVASAVLITCLKVSGWGNPWAIEWTVSLVGLGAVGILIAASVRTSWVSAVLSAPPLVGFGVISYSIYLWHYPLAVFLRERLPWYETWPLVLAIALTAATASYLFVERPLQRYRRGLSARRREAADERMAVPAGATATTSA